MTLEALPAYPENENRVQALNCVNTNSTLEWKCGRDFQVSLSALAEWYRPSTTSERKRELIRDDLERAVEQLTSNDA